MLLASRAGPADCTVAFCLFSAHSMPGAPTWAALTAVFETPPVGAFALGSTIRVGYARAVPRAAVRARLAASRTNPTRLALAYWVLVGV